MKNSDILLEVLTHMEWADYIVWQSVINYPAAGQDDKIKEIFFHYHTVQKIYLQIWKKQAFNIPDKAKFKSIHSLLQFAIQYYDELNEYFNEIDNYDADENIIVPWIKTVNQFLGRQAENINLAETMLHVSIHSSHHRGQINKRLRELGNKPETIDFIAWAWSGKPPANWKAIISDKSLSHL